jgi:cbb3-type cytochrome oxidase subunit 1
MTTADRLPTRALPLLYLGTAHVSLALAFLFAACWPHAVAGFFYHAWLIGLVHLVTLGWISFSILGTIYIVGPLALQMEMPARPLDYVAYASALVGLIGMIGHFWIQQYVGMAWSAGTVASGVLYMTARIAWRVRRAKIPAAVKLHVILSCVNFWLAASMGLFIAIDKVVHVLPGFVLSNVFAHAHLAALGWATMMVVGVGYRLLPMTFPSKIPSGRSLWASALLLETGVLGLFTTLLFRSTWTIVFGVLIVAGLAVFIAHVVWMRRHLAAKPHGVRRINLGCCTRRIRRGR